MNCTSVKEEIRHAMIVFDRGNFTLLNATNKPIESRANEILNLMSECFSFSRKKWNHLIMMKTRTIDW